MKSIVRLKVSLFTRVFLVSSLALCIAEPFISSRANITAVKLFPLSFRNISKSNDITKNESIFGPMAKISRVVPIKRMPKVEYPMPDFKSFPDLTNSKNYSNLSVKNNNSMGSGNVSSKFYLKKKFNFPIRDKLPTSTIFPELPKAEKLISENPSLLTSDSWNYLNSAVTDDEVLKIISDLSDEIVMNKSKIDKYNPMERQNLLLDHVLGELDNVKLSTMLPLPEEKVHSEVNKGVRFSTKNRKPILNVKPLEQNPGENSLKDANTTTSKTERWNISGVVSNGELSYTTQVPLYSFNDQVDVETESTNGKQDSQIETVTAASSSDHRNATTPTLLQVLAVPEPLPINSPTFPPFLIKSGFVSEKSVTSSAPYFNKTLIKLEEGNEISIDSKSNRYKAKSSFTSTFRKPRGPPIEEEYLLPPITSTSTSSPEEHIKGYQTISESTTQGPKVIWYNHNQTPEDTFYPNFDNFLVPPEESSSEILTDIILPLQPAHNDGPSDSKLLSDVPFNENNNKGQRNNKGMPILYRNNKEGIDKPRKKTTKMPILQQAATSDHDSVRDYYEYLDGKNYGSSTKGNVYEERRHGTASHNNYDDVLKDHEIIPRHQTNRKPPPYSDDDTESHGALNVVDHFYDSYPSPPVRGTKTYEINPYRGNDMINSYMTKGAQHSYGTGNGPTNDSPVKREPKYRFKESSPGFDPSYEHNPGSYNDHHGYGEQHGHGWKDSSKDFFAMAKDYFKNSDFSTAEKWFEVSIGVLAFLAFGGYIAMLLYQVFAVSSGTSIGMLLGRSMEGAGEIFDIFFSKGPIGQAYLDELETIVKRAMANVKKIWVNSSFKEKVELKVKGDVHE